MRCLAQSIFKCLYSFFQNVMCLSHNVFLDEWNSLRPEASTDGPSSNLLGRCILEGTATTKKEMKSSDKRKKEKENYINL